jgi:hypothetical protein
MLMKLTIIDKWLLKERKKHWVTDGLAPSMEVSASRPRD